jgi:hypothetical protein
MKRIALFLLLAAAVHAQVYSPRALVKGQVDSSDLNTLARGIYDQAHAITPREKAEAIWRFFLTDGRFVKPGFWYHIAGWAYEEPAGEVLDPVKLLNSYGFGLCYHIAPLLEAVYKAGGFEDARVWFLTGHTVAEVFYEGAYHYFDSDMMGYNSVGAGDPRRSTVASVHQIEQDGQIMLCKLKAPRDVNAKLVDDPWYPADVREAAIDGLAELFTTTADNRLFPFTRYARGHSMEFTLRPGERLIRYFRPEEPGLFYLPYRRMEKGWEEFPQEVAQYQIRTADGPRSQKDNRVWSTGRLEYTPALSDPRAYYSKAPGEAVFQVVSPYVIIDARFSLELDIGSNTEAVQIETSTIPQTLGDGAARRGTFGAWSSHGGKWPLRVSREDQDTFDRRATEATYARHPFRSESAHTACAGGGNQRAGLPREPGSTAVAGSHRNGADRAVCPCGERALRGRASAGISGVARQPARRDRSRADSARRQDPERLRCGWPLSRHSPWRGAGQIDSRGSQHRIRNGCAG